MPETFSDTFDEELLGKFRAAEMLRQKERQRNSERASVWLSLFLLGISCSLFWGLAIYGAWKLWEAF